ncbi:E3 ubiquitin-protein ligase RNF31-like, partial [Rhincodon typus]|uniref:E3 ubiquitin-protein ligase RNF31-like n=1 Tax=Rhincodon typus TaxID=259920 RepID=UPI002030BC2E
MTEDKGQHPLVLRERAVLALTAGHSQALSALLQDMVRARCPLEEKYQEVDVTKVLRENVAAKVQPNEGLVTISRAFNILEKYGRNLLSEHKPKFWRAVKFNNPVFKTTVDGINGGRSILRLYGYTVEHSDGMSFPDDTEEPDHRKVAAVTLEVAMLQIELNLLQKERPLSGGPGSDPYRLAPRTRAPCPGFQPLRSSARAVCSLCRVSVPVPLDVSCAVCSKEELSIHCQNCGWLLCRDCDALYHRHPSRGGHQRIALLGGGAANAVPLPPSEDLSRASLGAPAPPMGGLWAAVPGSVPPPVTEQREEVSRRPGLAWRSLSMEQPSCVPASRPDRRLSELGAVPGSRGPWACASCGLVNEGRAVLCGACERPRASPAPAAASSSAAAPREGWACRACTFQNEACAVLCSACDRPRLAGRPNVAVTTTTNSILQQTLPPPPSQQQGWECQFCTYLNLNASQICEVCEQASARAGQGQAVPAGTSPRPKQQRLEERLGATPSGDGSDEADQARQEEMRAAGLCLVQMIRMGEEQLVSPEEVCCALRSSGTEEPLVWLQTELPQMLDSIADLASQKGQAMPENEVGPVTRDEARQAWLLSGGDFEEAVGECVRTRARKVRL